MSRDAKADSIAPGDCRWPADLPSRVFRPWDMRPVEAHRASADPRLPRILFIGFSDRRGGAAIASSRLIAALEAQGLAATMELVCLQKANAPWTFSLDRAHQFPVWHNLRKAVALRNMLASDPYGWLPFDTAYLRRVLNIWQPDVVHLHNLHGGRGILPLRQMRMVSRRAPIVWTLHDMWPATGHCAYSLDCEGWREGCGKCPNLSLYPGLLYDRTKAITAEKRAIFDTAGPTLVTPSQWLRDVMRMATPTRNCDVRVIPNGIELGIFDPSARTAGRERIGLAPDQTALMFAAETLGGDRRKGGRELRAAMAHLQSIRQEAPLSVILMGEAGEGLLSGIGGLTVVSSGYVCDHREAATLYAAADLFICPSKQDNLPNTLLEAAGCGTPAAVFAAGGAAEAIEHGKTGVAVPAGDATALGEAIASLVADPARLSAMRIATRQRAEELYGDERMARDYSALYRQLLAPGKALS